MRRVIVALVVLVFSLSSASVFAQDMTDEGGGGDGGDDGERSKFYDFDDMLVDGQLKEPDMVDMDAQGEAQFERLLDLKKSFMPKIKESGEEAALQ
ncbi:MAG: hypothetical protein ACOCV2_02750 [Persicimonas sp.]